ncbi:MAG: hypothetical protein WBQ69_13115 [Gallionella sp.]
MNRQIIARRLSIAVSHWPDVTQSRKTEKLGYWKGIGPEFRMIADLLQVVYPLALISHIHYLLALRADHWGAKGSVFRIGKLLENRR